MSIKSAKEAKALSIKNKRNIEKILNRIDSHINRSISYYETELLVTDSGSLSALFLDASLREDVFKTLVDLGYNVHYYKGFYSRKRFILIEWGNIACDSNEQEILEREEIDKQLKDLQKSLKITP